MIYSRRRGPSIAFIHFHDLEDETMDSTQEINGLGGHEWCGLSKQYSLFCSKYLDQFSTAVNAEGETLLSSRLS